MLKPYQNLAVLLNLSKSLVTPSINIIADNFEIPYFFETKQAISAASSQNSAQSFVHVDCAEPQNGSGIIFVWNKEKMSNIFPVFS
jgi:hypothetical protein